MQNSNIIINLAKLIDNDFPFGNEDGREAYRKLTNELDKYPDTSIFGISLEGIRATDASFPRESVISLIKAKKGEKGFYLLDFASKDLRDNWDYAAKAKEQSVIVLENGNYTIIGSSLKSGAKELLDFIMQEGTTTTSKTATQFDVSAQNASAKLKRLLVQGVIMGKKETADTGGIEFIYKAIKQI